MFLRQWHTEFMSLSWPSMLEPVSNIKTSLTEGSCSPINFSHRIIVERQQLKSSMGDKSTGKTAGGFPE